MKTGTSYRLGNQTLTLRLMAEIITTASAAALLFGTAIDLRTKLNWLTRTVAPGASAATRYEDACSQRTRLRDQFFAELKAIGSSDEATTWAHRILDAKNSLIAADARQVEDAFQTRLTSFGTTADTATYGYRQFHPHSSRLRQLSGQNPPGEHPLPTASTRAGWCIPSRAAFVTRTTSSSWPNSRA